QPEAFPTRVRKPAAIHGQRVPVYEATLCGIRQKGDRTRNIIGARESAHRHAAGYVLVRVQTSRLRSGIHRGFYPAWTYRIAADTAPAPLRRQRACQPDQAVFAGVVRGSVRNT